MMSSSSLAKTGVGPAGRVPPGAVPVLYVPGGCAVRGGRGGAVPSARAGCSATVMRGGKGNAQMIPGWPYSFVVALEPGRTCWMLPLDVVCLGPAQAAHHRGDPHPPDRGSSAGGQRPEPVWLCLRCPRYRQLPSRRGDLDAGCSCPGPGPCQDHGQLLARDDGPGTSAQHAASSGQVWTVRPCLRIRRLGVRVPPSAPPNDQVTGLTPHPPELQLLLEVGQRPQPIDAGHPRPRGGRSRFTLGGGWQRRPFTWQAASSMSCGSQEGRRDERVR
jgi:hypothetical protein